MAAVKKIQVRTLAIMYNFRMKPELSFFRPGAQRGERFSPGDDVGVRSTCDPAIMISNDLKKPANLETCNFISNISSKSKPNEEECGVIRDCENNKCCQWFCCL